MCTEAVLIKNVIHIKELQEWPSVECTIFDEETIYYTDVYDYIYTVDWYNVTYEITGTLYNSSTSYASGLSLQVGEQTTCVYNPADFWEVYFTDFLNNKHQEDIQAVWLVLLGQFTFFAVIVVSVVPLYICATTKNALEYHTPQTWSHTVNTSEFSEVSRDSILEVTRYLSIFENPQILAGKRIGQRRAIKLRIIFNIMGIFIYLIGLGISTLVFVFWGEQFVDLSGLYIVSFLAGTGSIAMSYVGIMSVLTSWTRSTQTYLFITQHSGILLRPNGGWIFGGPRFIVTSFDLGGPGAFRSETQEGYYRVYYGDCYLTDVDSEWEVASISSFILANTKSPLSV